MIVDGSAKNLLAHGVYFAAMSTSWIRTFTVPDCPRDCSACDEFTNANDGSSSHTACVGASGRCWSSPLFRSRACAIRRSHMPNVASDQRRHPQWDIQHGIQRRRYAPMRDHAVRTGGGGPSAVCAHGGGVGGCAGATMVIATANCSVQAYDTCSGSLLWSTPCPLDVCSQQYTCGASLVASTCQLHATPGAHLTCVLLAIPATIAGGKTGAVLVSGAGIAQGFVDGVAAWKTGRNMSVGA